METLYIALILICLFLIRTCEMRKKVALRKAVSFAPTKPTKPAKPAAPAPPTISNSGMMEVGYGLAEEQAILYNNVPIPPQGQLHGWNWKN